MSILLLRQADGELLEADVDELIGKNRPSVNSKVRLAAHGANGPEYTVVDIGTRASMRDLKRRLDAGEQVPTKVRYHFRDFRTRFSCTFHREEAHSRARERRLSLLRPRGRRLP